MLKNAHLLRSPHPPSLQRTYKYASLLRISGDLHLGIFEHPAKNHIFSSLLNLSEGNTGEIGDPFSGSPELFDPVPFGGVKGIGFFLLVNNRKFHNPNRVAFRAEAEETGKGRLFGPRGRLEGPGVFGEI